MRYNTSISIPIYNPFLFSMAKRAGINNDNYSFLVIFHH